MKTLVKAELTKDNGQKKVIKVKSNNGQELAQLNIQTVLNTKDKQKMENLMD